MRGKNLWIGYLLPGVIAAAVLAGCGNKTADSQLAKTGSEESVQDPAGQTALQPVRNTEDTEFTQRDGSGNNILIAYFAVAENSDVDAVSSASVVTVNGGAEGRLQHLAKLIQEETGGELFSIQTAVDYPGDGGKLIDYAAEEQDQDTRPEITNHIENLDQYDVVFVGYPTWWYDLPQVMYSFFDEYNFAGKTIIPFNSHNGSRFSGTIETITELEPGAKVLTDGFTVSERNVADAGDDIADWVRSLDF